jgi:hypothetical protein
VFDKIYKIELPIPFPLRATNVFFIDEPPRTLVDTGIKEAVGLLEILREKKMVKVEQRGGKDYYSLET